MYKKIFLIISRFIIAIIISIIVFNYISFSFNLLLTISLLIIIYCCCSFHKNNKHFLFEITFIITAIIIGYIIVKLTPHVVENKYIIATLIIIGFYMFGFLCGDRKTENSNKIHLFEQQQNDVLRLKQYINSSDTIGINGKWGTGKSFITDFFIKQNEDKYTSVVISLLNCDVDNITEILIDRISDILKSNLIFSKYANEIVKSFKSIGVVQNILSFFWKNNYSYGDIFEGFKNECKQLNKPILIVFEDIDRIKTTENLERLFSIAEKVTCDKIKIIYQYDEKHMQEIGYDRDYLEKYIPYQIDITPIDFFELIKYFLKDYGSITEENFRMLRYRLEVGFDVSIGTYSMHIGFNKINYSIRRIKIYLKDLDTMLSNDIFNTKEDIEIAVAILFIKHCINNVYQEIKEEANLFEHLDLLNIIHFKYNNEDYTIQEILKKIDDGQLSKDDIGKMFDNYENCDRLVTLLLLGFEVNYKLPKARQTDDMYILTQKDSFEKRNRLIWYIMYSGESEYTNYEAAAKYFAEDVLSKPLYDQKQAFYNFWNCMFNESLYKNNHTIQKLGERGTTCIFKALYVAQSAVSSEDWINWINLYFDIEDIKKINNSFIDDIYYCNINNNKVYIHMLNKFNNLKIIGNMNNDKIYKRFLIKYLRVLSALGYIDTYAIDYFSPDTDNIDIQMTSSGLDVFKRKLEELKRNIGTTVNQIKNDIETIIQFIEKNKEIINISEPLNRPKSPIVSTTSTTKFIHQDEFDRLLSIQDNKKFLQELDKSYSDSKISAYEVQELLKKRSHK